MFGNYWPHGGAQKPNRPRFGPWPAWKRCV